MVEEKKEFPWVVLDEEVEDEGQQRIILLYGPSGVGKTYLAAQFPEPLFLSCDPGKLGGALSAKRFKPKQLKINSYQDLLGSFPLLEEQAGKEFKTIICDSISYLAKIVMGDMLTRSGRELAQLQDWGLLIERIRKVALFLTDLDCHVVFTAVDALQKNENTGDIYGGPDLPGRLAKELPQYCDVVARLFVESQMKVVSGKAIRTPYYTYTVVGDSTYMAKDRTGLMEASGPSSFESFEVLF